MTVKKLGKEPQQGLSKNLLVLETALPEDKDLPASFSEGLRVFLVSNPIPSALAVPIGFVRRWAFLSVGTRMHVPKAAMYENHLASPKEHKIGLSGKRALIETVSESQGVNHPPDRQFRSRIPGSNRRHRCATLLASEDIRHSLLYPLPPSSSRRRWEAKLSSRRACVRRVRRRPAVTCRSLITLAKAAMVLARRAIRTSGCFR